MKRLICFLGGAGVLAAAVCLNLGSTTQSDPTPGVAAEPAAAGANLQRKDDAAARHGPPVSDAAKRLAAAFTAAEKREQNVSGALDDKQLSEAIDLLISPRASFEEKQKLWKDLRDGGHLDQLIDALRERSVLEPNRAEYPAELGQAYLKKASASTDLVAQAALAVQADSAFDAALQLDPANWDARYLKTTALTYWPANHQLQDQIIQNYQTLIQQQEGESSQPEFAKTYLHLGDEYQKTGQAENALAVWQRGAALFPENGDLQSRLAKPQ